MLATVVVNTTSWFSATVGATVWLRPTFGASHSTDVSPLAIGTTEPEGVDGSGGLRMSTEMRLMPPPGAACTIRARASPSALLRTMTSCVRFGRKIAGGPSRIL